MLRLRDKTLTESKMVWRVILRQVLVRGLLEWMCRSSLWKKLTLSWNVSEPPGEDSRPASQNTGVLPQRLSGGALNFTRLHRIKERRHNARNAVCFHIACQHCRIITQVRFLHRRLGGIILQVNGGVKCSTVSPGAATPLIIITESHGPMFLCRKRMKVAAMMFLSLQLSSKGG